MTCAPRRWAKRRGLESNPGRGLATQPASTGARNRKPGESVFSNTTPWVKVAATARNRMPMQIQMTLARAWEPRAQRHSDSLA